MNGDVIVYDESGWRVRLERYASVGYGTAVAATVRDPDGNELHAGRSTAEFSAEGAAAYLVTARKLLALSLERMRGTDE